MKKIALVLCLSFPFSAFSADRIMTVDRQSDEAFFEITVQDDDVISGTWLGWCTDWGRLIEDGVNYQAKFYSSYSSSLPEGLIDRPENLDEMNWVLNQHFVGVESSSGLGAYTVRGCSASDLVFGG